RGHVRDSETDHRESAAERVAIKLTAKPLRTPSTPKTGNKKRSTCKRQLKKNKKPKTKSVLEQCPFGLGVLGVPLACWRLVPSVVNQFE
ncbi:MAG: hypothetical protein ABJB97_11955, partial [Acidobacteriota bacterium]